MNTRAPGDLDPTFNGNGKVVVQFPTPRGGPGECVAEGPDGKIYVGGALEHTDDNIASKLGIARLHKDGTLDKNFGEDGYVVVSFGPLQDTHLRQIVFLTIEGRPRILMSGVDMKAGDAVFVRLHEDGRLDDGFGVNGLLTVKIPTSLAEHLQKGDGNTSPLRVGPCKVVDGKIYVAIRMYMPIWIAYVANVVRLNIDGSLDTSFNKVGYVAITNQHWGHSHVRDILVHNGKITVCGQLIDKNMTARLNEDGSFDTGFGDQGFKLIDNADLLWAFEKLTQYSETSVLVAGKDKLACFTEKGLFEPAFNNGQMLIKPVAGAIFNSVDIYNGKIIASGRLYEGNTPSFLVARFSMDGKLDSRFGDGKGWTTFNFEGQWSEANAMTVQKDGDVLMAGGSRASLIARVLNDA